MEFYPEDSTQQDYIFDQVLRGDELSICLARGLGVSYDGNEEDN